MRADRKRLLRLQRLEKVRYLAMQAAAREVAEAESTLVQLEALAARTGQLLGTYALRAGSTDGASLQNLSRFHLGLARVSDETRADAEKARWLANTKLALLADAERSRQAVEDRARGEAEAINRSKGETTLGARQQLGTGLE